MWKRGIGDEEKRGEGEKEEAMGAVKYFNGCSRLYHRDGVCPLIVSIIIAAVLSEIILTVV